MKERQALELLTMLRAFHFGPLSNPLLIDGPRPRKTQFFSNLDDDAPNYSSLSDNSENDETAMSARHDRTSGDMLLDPTYRPRKCHGKLLLNAFAQTNSNADKKIASDCRFHFFHILCFSWMCSIKVSHRKLDHYGGNHAPTGVQ